MISSSKNPSDAPTKVQDLEYLYASIVNVSNIVSVKLSGDGNYHLWKTQMLCLMKSHNMAGIVDDSFVSPRGSNKDTMDQYDSLLKGWIFGSTSENVLGAVIDLDSAKDVWDKLKSFYDATISYQQGNAASKNLEGETKAVAKPEAVMKTETKDDVDLIPEQTRASGEERVVIDVLARNTEAETEAAENESATIKKTKDKRKLCEAAMKGDWSAADYILRKDKDLVRETISSDGSTVLQIAVGIGHNDFVKNLFSYISDEDIVATRNSDGSTALHIAAIVGNKYAADLLLKKNKNCLQIRDKNCQEPLHKAYENMHLDTIGYLLKAVDEYGKSMSRSFSIGASVHSHLHPGVEIGVNLLVNAISAKQYNLALELIEKFPKFASKNDDVLMAIAKTFPSGDYGKTYETITLKDFCQFIWLVVKGSVSFSTLRGFLMDAEFHCYPSLKRLTLYVMFIASFSLIFLLVDVLMFAFCLILLVGWLLSFMISTGRILVEPITHHRKKMIEMDEAEKVLELVCDEIDKLEFTGTHHPYYTRPFLEAACQNAHKVVDEILYRSPEVILSTDKSGYDIIQLAVIHRSERIYNLIYDIGERKNLYRTIVDSSKNNILHLAGRLAPSRKLNHTAGAALRLQGELQWRQEVKNVVYPTYITQENIFMETPDMVFTREHENLLKEGEQWMKTTAESSSITAALITTIVFAAAITVPGGSNQDTGMPVFTKDIAFIVFGVSDAISLFTSSTALLVFLSILTARFSEKDFLVSLPRRLLIGICSLLISAISMIVAFSSSMFLVFYHQKQWMLVPICGLSLIPISFFVALQLPLIMDLFRSTYRRKFGPRRRGKRARFNPDNIRLFFGK